MRHSPETIDAVRCVTTCAEKLTNSQVCVPHDIEINENKSKQNNDDNDDDDDDDNNNNNNSASCDEGSVKAKTEADVLS